MRIALLSDIHANLPALRAVLDHIDARGDVGSTYHLGDLVGYAPWPDETVALLRARGISGVAGNYDSTVATAHPHCGCRSENPQQEALAHQSYAWTLAYTSAATKRTLAELPFRCDVRPLGGHVTGPTMTLVHGTPLNNLTYWTEDRSDEFCAKMAEAVGAGGGDIIASGHTHLPWHREVGGVHFVNAGSVGRPKDGDWRAGYAVITLDTSGVRSEQVRVEYDVEEAVRGIIASGLPDDFAEFLRNGGASLRARSG